MIDKLFIDECHTSTLVAIAKHRGVIADYGPHIGKSGWSDWRIVEFALGNDYVVVTNNRRDFLREYAKVSLHNGLLVIVPNLGSRVQIRLFGLVLDRALQLGADRQTGSWKSLPTAPYTCANGRANSTTSAISTIRVGGERQRDLIAPDVQSAGYPYRRATGARIDPISRACRSHRMWRNTDLAEVAVSLTMTQAQQGYVNSAVLFEEHDLSSSINWTLQIV